MLPAPAPTACIPARALRLIFAARPKHRHCLCTLLHLFCFHPLTRPLCIAIAYSAASPSFRPFLLSLLFRFAGRSFPRRRRLACLQSYSIPVHGPIIYPQHACPRSIPSLLSVRLLAALAATSTVSPPTALQAFLLPAVASKHSIAPTACTPLGLSSNFHRYTPPNTQHLPRYSRLYQAPTTTLFAS